MITIFHLILITWFIINFEPGQNIFYRITERWNNFFTNEMFNVLSCPKCLGFWLTLSCSFNFYYAVIVSIISYMLNKLTK